MQKKAALDAKILNQAQKGRKLTSPKGEIGNMGQPQKKSSTFFNKRETSPTKNAAVLATNGSNPNLNTNIESSG